MPDFRAEIRDKAILDIGVGSGRTVPYLNSLIGQGGLGTQYFANTHPSIGNYFELTTGQIITNNDSFSGTVSVPDIVTALDTARQTWKSYAESLPSVGYTGGDVFPYLRRHNPFTYFTEVRNNSNNLLNLQTFSQFSIDLNHGQLAKFSYIVPNALHDVHISQRRKDRRRDLSETNPRSLRHRHIFHSLDPRMATERVD